MLRFNISRLSHTLAIFSLIISSSFVASSASATEPAFRPGIGIYPENTVSFVVNEGYNSQALFLQSNYLVFWADEEERRKGWRGACYSPGDPACALLKTRGGEVWSVLPVCDLTISTNCIESVAFSLKGSEFQEGTFERYVEGPTMPADSETGFIGGSTAGIWNTKVAPHRGGSGTYLVSPVTQFHFDVRTGKFEIRQFNMQVLPFLHKSGPFLPDQWATPEQVTNSTQFGDRPFAYREKVRQGARLDPDCVHLETDKCIVQYDFEEDVAVRVKIRLTNTLGGWFMGRLDDPQISIAPIPNENNLLTVTAKPVRVPRLEHVVPLKSLTAKEAELLETYFFSGIKTTSSKAGTASESPEVFKFVEAIRPLVKDSSRGVTSVWSFSTARNESNSKCLADTSKVLGIVTTNSLGFQGSAPTFDGSSLNYRVIGLHYGPDQKTVNRGTYDLVMLDEVAQCLYGLKDAPVSATISVSGSDSEQIVSTTVVNSRDGWLKLRADNFTFSEKTIKVQLSQEKLSEAETKTTLTRPVGNSQSAVTSKSTKKIVCVKKGSKSIRSSKATCPKGYRVKG